MQSIAKKGKFPLLIKEIILGEVDLRMSVAQFGAMLAILNSLCKNLYSALCCETKWINLSDAILDFGVHSHLSKCLLRIQKTQKI